jgi:CheY-like chemotaxis protein
MGAKIVSKFEEAQSIIGIEEFRVLIVDIVSESKKAVMFLKANQINPTGRIPSIALISLGKNATPDLHQIANETITKPLKTETLAKTIAKIINKKEVSKDIPLTIQAQSDVPTINAFNKNLPLDKIKNLKILVAEDNPVNQKLIKSVLTKMGFTPKLVENGRLAVEEEEKEKYDLILMDLQMPEMDGINATKNIIINARKRTRPKIIAVTANAMPGDKERCLDAGMDDYISKPIQFQLLSEKITQWVNLDKLTESNNEKDSNKLPPQVTTPSTGVPPMDAEKTPQSLKLLVAEDNAVNQKLIISILKKLGYNATLVENGLLAYEACLKEKYDIIIMDLQMPVMDGLDASRKIKSSDSINPKPTIIALTANAMTGDKERCLGAGMDDYMTKPIQIKILEENLKKWGNIK